MEETTSTLQLLQPSRWHSLRDRHEARVEPWIAPHLDRRRSGTAHPVEDFLFGYYAFRPAALKRWHPGFGVALADAQGYVGLKGYADLGGCTGVTGEHVASQRPLLRSLRALLCATASRPANFGCFGMHEWAMVYGLDDDQLRHPTWPLRLGSAGTAKVVESHRISCSHFDAFRFFTEPARPLNVLQPGRDDRTAYEQPACLHAGMDLYKHAFRLVPMVGSELVADCFELARDIRVLDMRASPYDLTDLGHQPVPVETVEGKQDYVAAQRAFAARAAPLRRRLVDEVDRILGLLGSSLDR